MTRSVALDKGMIGHREPKLLLRRSPWSILWSKGAQAPVPASETPPTPSDFVFAFASIGHDSIRPPSAEFIGSATAGGRGAVFVLDESRSWTMAPGWPQVLVEVLAELRARQRVGRILAMGQSMGAFAALAAAEVLPIEAVLAFGPQARTHLPGECRWGAWTHNLPDLACPLPRGPRITLFHGLQDDAAQAAAFPQRSDIDHLLFPDQDHSGLVPHLKARGCLAGLIEAALQGDRRRLLRIAASAGGRRRGQEPR